MPVADQEIDLRRREIQKILASREFASSRQLREFLQYVSEAAFNGRTHLEQAEIADKVLKRGADFNPLDDASVRKLGTALRQRLQNYYETEGLEDPVRVTLPVRSYVPSFEVRPEPPQTVAPDPISQPTRSRRWLLGGTGAAGLAAIGGFTWLSRRLSDQEASPAFVIHSWQGDIMHKRNDVAPDAILFGPSFGSAREMTARLVFPAERATQQAGILIFGDPDRYVKLGRQFLSRPQLEFGLETQGRYLKPPGTFAFDPDAYTGQPIWLKIRHQWPEYRAFVSSDGSRWRPFGNVLQMPEGMGDARAAIYAHNGRSNAVSADAKFDKVSIGISFHDYPAGPVDLSLFPGWRITSSPSSVLLDGECLVLVGSKEWGHPEFLTPIPAGDWTISTRLDFLPLDGVTSGLTVIGSKAQFRLIRWDLDGGSITAEYLGQGQVNAKDAEGAPPVILKMTCRNGVLQSSFSWDDRRFQEIPLKVPLHDLGDNLSVGFHVSRSSWKPGGNPVTSRFYYLRQELTSLRQTDAKASASH